MFFRRQNLIGTRILTNFCFAACILLCVFAIEAQTKHTPAQNESNNKLLAEAASALDAEDLSRAAAVLQKVLLSEPRNSAAHTLAGITADRQNNLEAAEKHFATAAKLSPDAPEARNNYGAILLRLKKKPEAAKEFAASLRANPNQRSALVNLAQIRFDENNLPAARQLFEKAKAITPDAEIARALVVISLRLSDREQAAKNYREYATLAKTVELPAALRAELGTALFESNLNDEAIQELEIAVALDESKLNAIVSLSRAYVKRKDIKSAGKLLESVVARGVADAGIYAALADVYEAGGFVENAIPAMRLAVNKEPKNEFYRFRYGMLLTNSKVPAAGVIRLEEAIKEFPNSARLWLALGIAHYDENKTAEAQVAFEKALTIDAKLVPALAYLGTVNVERANYGEAVKFYEHALAVDESNAVLRYLLADTLLKIPTSDAAQIEKHLKRAVEIDDNLSSAHLTLGRLYVRQERWTEAANSLERAAQLQPKQAETFYQLGRVYARLKRREESRVALEKFKRLSESQKEQKETDRRELVRRLTNVRF